MKKTLRVVYDGKPDDATYALETELKTLLEKHGYKWYAQGYDFVDEKRDIAYDMPPVFPKYRRVPQGFAAQE